MRLVGEGVDPPTGLKVARVGHGLYGSLWVKIRYDQLSSAMPAALQIQQGLIFLLGCPACAHNFR